MVPFSAAAKIKIVDPMHTLTGVGGAKFSTHPPL
jgi:hypothetical protein